MTGQTKNELLNSIRTGTTIGIRLTTLAHALQQQYHRAQKEGPEDFAVWEQDYTAMIPQLCQAVEGQVSGSQTASAQSGNPAA